MTTPIVDVGHVGVLQVMMPSCMECEDTLNTMNSIHVQLDAECKWPVVRMLATRTTEDVKGIQLGPLRAVYS